MSLWPCYSQHHSFLILYICSSVWTVLLNWQEILNFPLEDIRESNYANLKSGRLGGDVWSAFFSFNPLWYQFTETVLFVRFFPFVYFAGRTVKIEIFKRNAVTYTSADLFLGWEETMALF